MEEDDWRGGERKGRREREIGWFVPTHVCTSRSKMLHKYEMMGGWKDKKLNLALRSAFLPVLSKVVPVDKGIALA